MPIYSSPPPHERLSVFFGEFFREIRRAEPSTYGAFLLRAEEEFKRTGYREEISSGVKNILLVRLDAIGDMVLNSAFLREVRANFPQARITLICSPLTFPLVELCPYVNEILTFDQDKFGGNFPDVLERLVEFCKENLWQKHFSTAFSPQWGSHNLSALLLCWLSGARERIGYGVNPYRGWDFEYSAEDAARDNFLLTKNIVSPRSAVAEVEKTFYLLEAAGLKVNSNHVELFYGARDLIRARELLKGISDKKVLLGIGAGGGSRKYPVEKYLIALKELVKKDLVFVIVGGKAELEDAAYLEENLPRGKVLNLVGKTTLRETEAVVAQTDYYLGNDTGVMHMAAACEIPCLVLYREAQDKESFLPGALSEFRRFPPYQTNSAVLRPDHQLDDCAAKGPIYGWCHSKEPHCITQITPQEIIDAFETLEKL